jgi:hypothetical protein
MMGNHSLQHKSAFHSQRVHTPRARLATEESAQQVQTAMMKADAKKTN